MLRTTPKTRTLLIHSKGRLATRGLTLVEMLISMAVTLVMMAAVVNLFANIGAGVRNRNASMELGTQLRLARARLFKDLAGATSAARPKLPSDDHDDGYLEIIEGQWSDKNPSGLVTATSIDTNNGLDSKTSILPRDNNGQLIQWDDTDGDGVFDGGENYFSGFSGLGDYDDILALTVRSESEPFVGRLPVWQDPDGPGGPEPFQWVVTTIESDLAEVIWYAVQNPADGSSGEPGMRTIYRRVLLIAPWVSELPPYVKTSAPSQPNNRIVFDQIYYHRSDVSFRQEGSLRVPNTLSDLTKRENRFAHFFDSTLTDRGFPHGIDLSAIRVDPPITTTSKFPTGSVSVLHPFGLPFEWHPSDPDPANPTIPPAIDRQGEDVMLNDVLAFDLRVYDPGAPLLSNATGSVLEPSDAGWIAPTTTVNTVGYGAYVDLFWNRTGIVLPSGANIPEPFFAEAAHTKSLLTIAAPPAVFASITYDTWPYHYESDGINQDEDYINNNRIPANENIDEGTNGLDDPDPTLGGQRDLVDHGLDLATNGVDDSQERETIPPYDTPLRGMQVKIRVYDRDSRQIREATVTRNFVPQ